MWDFCHWIGYAGRKNCSRKLWHAQRFCPLLFLYARHMNERYVLLIMQFQIMTRVSAIKFSACKFVLLIIIYLLFWRWKQYFHLKHRRTSTSIHNVMWRPYIYHCEKPRIQNGNRDMFIQPVSFMACHSWVYEYWNHRKIGENVHILSI
jgi:hypothetical protein